MTKSEMGKKSRRDGMAFERKVREDLRSEGWIVDKWTNNVEFAEATLCSADSKRSVQIKHKFAKMHPAKSFRGITRSNGFPDFIAFRIYNERFSKEVYEVIAVESKMNGTLSKQEKEKCQWYLDNNIFSKIWIASKGEKRGSIIYEEFK